MSRNLFGQTDGQTDRRTDSTIHRAAWSQLKIHWLLAAVAHALVHIRCQGFYDNTEAVEYHHCLSVSMFQTLRNITPAQHLIQSIPHTPQLHLTRQNSTQSVGNMLPPPWHLLPHVLQIMPRTPNMTNFSQRITIMRKIHRAWLKCLETPNLTHFTKSK